MIAPSHVDFIFCSRMLVRMRLVKSVNILVGLLRSIVYYL